MDNLNEILLRLISSNKNYDVQEYLNFYIKENSILFFFNSYIFVQLISCLITMFQVPKTITTLVLIEKNNECDVVVSLTIDSIATITRHHKKTMLTLAKQISI